VNEYAGRDFADTSAELIALYPDEAENIRRWGAEFGGTIGDLLPGMADLVADLDAARVPLYAITNFSHEFWPSFRAREAALFDRFRDAVVSGEVKLVKPDPAIYALALDRFGLVPGEALFVDDRADNVAAAERAVQIFGAMGTTREVSVQVHFRRARFLALLLGSNDTDRETLAGLLGFGR